MLLVAHLSGNSYYVKNRNDQNHSYLKAHVKNVNVYYMGTLHIYNDQIKEDYIYYTTDKQITNKTVYAVLKEGEKIKLQYKHDSDYQVNYEIINKATGMEETIGGWTVDDVFGSDRAYPIVIGNQVKMDIITSVEQMKLRNLLVIDRKIPIRELY